MAEHGIGLSSVKSTLKKYKSEISFSEDKYWFTVLIVIDKYEYIHLKEIVHIQFLFCYNGVNEVKI